MKNIIRKMRWAGQEKNLNHEEHREHEGKSWKREFLSGEDPGEVAIMKKNADSGLPAVLNRVGSGPESNGVMVVL